MINYRKYTENDLDYIVSKQNLLSLHHQQYDKEYYKQSANSKQEFKNYILKRISADDFNVIIAESNEGIIGYVMGWIKSRPPIYDIKKIGYLSNIFVDKEIRNAGVGKNLFTELEKWFKDKGVNYIEIKSDARNNDTIKKFRNYGFENLSISFYKKIRQ